VELEEKPPSPRIEAVLMADGFKLKYSGNGDAAAFPFQVSVLAAYEVRQGDPFTKHHPDDFDLRRAPIRIEHKGIRNLKASGKQLDFVAEGPEFEVRVTGFDPRRDLKVSFDKGTEPT